ncbi:hypothetical protein [Streptomyces sp. IMTB 2501]|uniref:hypothetical protein n=1 Tax=Streptomyces sp. IMTB 2501 TaxID=1776340 RepID=UPI0015BFA46F|nr:hypothetical protein [Streptomyces sp. IMTB 2501]
MTGALARAGIFSEGGGAVCVTGPNVELQRRPVAPDAAVRAICERVGGGFTRAQ